MSAELVLRDRDLALWRGGALEALREMPEASADLCVTSPPYWALRRYEVPDSVWGGEEGCEHAWGDTGPAHHPGQVADGKAVHGENASGQNAGSGRFCSRCGAWLGQLGLEPTPGMYVEHLGLIFGELRRVLAPHGSLLVVIGDTYASRWGSMRSGGGAGIRASTRTRGGPVATGLKAKDLVGVPFMLAFHLRDDLGWWWRGKYVWDKPNALPESVEDRCTVSDETILHFANSPRYYWDREAILEPAEWQRWGDQTVPKYGEEGETKSGWMRPRSNRELQEMARRRSPKGRTVRPSDDRGGNQGTGAIPVTPSLGRNRRSVWRIATESYREAHFAVFPRELPRVCIAAGSSEAGCCSECGVPWRRIVHRVGGPQGDHTAAGRTDGADAAVRETGRSGRASGAALSERYREHGFPEYLTLGWRPGCACNSPDLRPGDWDLIETPLGELEEDEDDLTLFEGRAGFARPRPEEGGVRAITRYEQRMLAAQLRASEHRDEMEAEAGAEAFAHYLRVDLAGARAIPPLLLDAWTERGWLEEVDAEGRLERAIVEAPPTRPSVVIDPFAGSGTTGHVARELARHSVMVEPGPGYCELIANRVSQLSLFAEAEEALA